MESKIQFEQFLDQHDAWIRDTIAKYGWAIQYVLGESVDEPPYGYTIGLSTFDRHPELMVAGLCQHDTAHILNLLGRRVKEGSHLWANQLIPDALPSGPLALLEIAASASDSLLLYANKWYQEPDGPPVRAFQVVWSDDNGALPWEDGWSLPHHAQLLANPLPG